MMSHDKLKHQVSQQFLSSDITFMSRRRLHNTITVKLIDTATNQCDMLHRFVLYSPGIYYKTLTPWKHMFYYILNTKMTSQSQNYSPATRSSMQKFDNDFDVIFMFNVSVNSKRYHPPGKPRGI